MKRIKVIILMSISISFSFSLVMLLAGCDVSEGYGGLVVDEIIEEYEPEEIDDEPEEEEEPEIASPPEGYVISPLTGLYISQEIAARRPFAVVYNNEPQAMPQAGLMQADIIYEVLAEGNITRLVAIFQDFDAGMIGPIRSTRHYFTYFAMEHGAVMVHHGGSPMGYNAIRSNSIPYVDGMRFDGSVFWRDATRRTQRGLEHSSYTSAQNLLNIAEQLNFDMSVQSDLGLFEFFDEPTSPRPHNAAHIINIPFTNTNTSIFEYDPQSGMYQKYIFGGAHMDDYAGTQVAVSNIIIQITDVTHIAGDAAGRRNVALTGSGRGYLVTNGTYAPITWRRNTPQSPTRWYTEDGAPLMVNRGITWVSVINNQPTFEVFDNTPTN